MSRLYRYTVETGEGVKSGEIVGEDASDVRQHLLVDYAGIPVGEITVKRIRRANLHRRNQQRVTEQRKRARRNA